jgi:hypothetical protein
VNQRALQELFALAKEKGENFRTEISVNVLEIYNEQLHDLLNKEHKKYPNFGEISLKIHVGMRSSYRQRRGVGW